MPFVRRLDKEKLRSLGIMATAAVTVVTVAFLLLRGRSTPVSAMPPAAPSYQATGMQVPSDPAQAEQATPAGQTLMELEPVTLYGNADADPPADQTSAAPRPVDSEDSTPSAIEQRIFKSRRALETIDPRELVKHGTAPR